MTAKPICSCKCNICFTTADFILVAFCRIRVKQSYLPNKRFQRSRVQKEKTKIVHFPMQFCFSPLSVVQQSYSSPTSSYLSTVYFLIKQTQQLIFKQRHKKDSRAVTSHMNTSIKRWETLPILEQRLPKQLWWSNPMGEICHSYALRSALSSN